MRAARVGLWLGLVVLFVMLLLPAPAGLTQAGWRVAAVGLLMAVWWITEAVPIPATALLPLVLFPLLDVTPIGPAAAPYANPVIFLFLGGFLLAAALQRSGLHRRMALAIVRAVGTEPERLVGGFMLATAFISMWVSNTATVVMMLPIALSVVELWEGTGTAEPEQPDLPVASPFGLALLLGLAYAANIGGMGTLIGTPPNALLAGFMDEAYGVHIGFAQWMLVGVPLVAVALPACWLLLTRVLHPHPRRSAPGTAGLIAGEVEALGRVRSAEWRVGAVAVLTAAAWVFRPLLEARLTGLSDAGIAVAAAVLLFALPRGGGAEGRLLTWEDAESLPWGVLVLFGGGLSLASAIEATGLATWIGESLSGLDRWPIVLVGLLVTTVIVFLTELTSNTATAAAFLPVAASLAVGVGAEPLLLAVPVALAASCAFMMPVATPPNAIVYGSGRITIPQMARAGLWLNALLILLVVAASFGLAPLVLGS